MVIDAHVHLYPPEVGLDPAGWAAAHWEPRWATLCTRVRADGRPVQGFPDVNQLLRDLDAAGVDRAVLLGWYWENHDTCAWHNRFLAACVRSHSDRLQACAAIHPGASPEVVAAEIRRAHGEGLCGLGELSPHTQGVPADAPGLIAALELAGGLGWPVNLHVTEPEGRPYPGRVETPLADFTAWARSLPRTTFVLAHWGGRLPLLEPAAAGLANVYYDTAASPILYGESAWTTLLPAFGTDRVLFGSDHPLDLYPRREPGPSLTRFTMEARAAQVPAPVLADNARRLFGGPGR
jgi:predicted TIM-barrel fold metal-dependent hydrolase